MKKNITQIALVCTFYNEKGGVSSYVKGLEKAFRNQRRLIAVISPDIDTNREFNRLKIKGRTRLGKLLSCFLMLLKVNSKHVHCHGAWYFIVACVLYKWFCFCIFKTRSITAIKHTDVLQEANIIRKWILNKIDNYCDQIVFVSNDSKNGYINANPKVDKSRLKVIWPGVADIRLEKTNSNQFQRILGREFEGSVITYMGLMEYQQKVDGLLRLLQALQLVRQKYKNVKLLIAGAGSLESQVDDTIVKLGLAGTAIRIGVISNRADFFSISDVHCHISFKDSFAIVILEALVCGVNVVANRIGDYKEIEFSGIKFCDEYPEDIAKEIISTLKNPVSIDRQLILSKMSWDKCATKFIELS